MVFCSSASFALTKYPTIINIPIHIRGRGVAWLTHQLVTLKTAGSTPVDPANLFRPSRRGKVFSFYPALIIFNDF